MSSANLGRFVWYDLLTVELAASCDFYSDVIGWQTQVWEAGHYTMWVGSQGPIGGAMPLSEEQRQARTPPHWMAHVQVADVDATVAMARAHGARICVEPRDIPKVGRFAVIADPLGASLSVLQPQSANLPPHDTTKPGEFCWNELVTTDHAAAFRFYAILFAWEKLGEHDMGAMGSYLLFGKDGKEMGGMMTAGKDCPPAWLYYTQVPDLDAATERAKARGARTVRGPHEVPGGARIIQLADPHGARFALHEQVHSLRG
jgi:predicted enzyme related to lactoylglutathione lyase